MWLFNAAVALVLNMPLVTDQYKQELQLVSFLLADTYPDKRYGCGHAILNTLKVATLWVSLHVCRVFPSSLASEERCGWHKDLFNFYNTPLALSATRKNRSKYLRTKEKYTNLDRSMYDKISYWKLIDWSEQFTHTKFWGLICNL